MTESLAMFRSFTEIEYAPKPSAVLRLGSSILFHAAGLAILIVIPRFHTATLSVPLPGPRGLVIPLQLDPLVLVGRNAGGGGGGGGKNQALPASRGDIPPAAPNQPSAPSAKDPDLKRPESEMVLQPTIQAPIQLPRFLEHYGVVSGSLAILSDGTGRGGGIGSGTETGVGSGRGPGAGSGSRSGWGDGQGSTVGNQTGPFVPGVKGVTSPQIVRQALPHYTDEAIKAKIEGIVVLQITVRRDGVVDAPRIVRSLGYGLDEEAIRCVSREWKFRPATQNGQPVDVYAYIEITFHLR